MNQLLAAFALVLSVLVTPVAALHDLKELLALATPDTEVTMRRNANGDPFPLEGTLLVDAQQTPQCTGFYVHLPDGRAALLIYGPTVQADSPVLLYLVFEDGVVVEWAGNKNACLDKV